MRKFNFTTNYGHDFANIEIYIPSECPHCNVVLIPKQVNYHLQNFNNKYIFFTFFQCTNPECLKNYYTVHLFDKNNHSEFISIYPKIKQVKFDKLICDCSKEFETIYNSAYKAQQEGYIKLAGAGYRMALEHLLKDYLFKYYTKDDLDKDKLPTMKLVNCIKFLDEQPRYGKACEVVRLLGNDYTHYQNKNEQVEFSYIKIYLDYFVEYILRELRFKNPPLEI